MKENERVDKNHRLSTRVHFKYKNTYRLKVKGQRKIYMVTLMKVRIAALISDKGNSRTRKIIINIDNININNNIIDTNINNIKENY